MSNVFTLATSTTKSVEEIRNLIREKCHLEVDDDGKFHIPYSDIWVMKKKPSNFEDIYLETFGFPAITKLIGCTYVRYAELLRVIMQCTMCILEDDPSDAVLYATYGGIGLTRINGELLVHDRVNGKNGRRHKADRDNYYKAHGKEPLWNYHEADLRRQEIILSEVTLPYRLKDIDIPGWG